MAGSIKSAAPYLAQLEDEEEEVKYYALDKINGVVDEFWAEIANDIQRIEVLYEDVAFKRRELAALVASKVYFHLEQFTEAMSFALGAGKLFDITAKSEFVGALVAKCIDEYIRLRQEDKQIDPRLERIVAEMFDRCYAEGAYKQALGIALESRRLDKIEESISRSGDVAGMLAYCLRVCNEVVKNRDFRQTVLRILVKLYNTLPSPDYLNISRCLVFLDDAPAISTILANLLNADTDQELLAYQIAFDLVENSTQQFLSTVRAHLPQPSGAAAPSATSGDKMDVEQNDGVSDKHAKLREILSGEKTINLTLDFLYHNNKADLAILKNIKQAVEVRNSVCHTATIFANAIMHCGTTRDNFLRDNLEWLARATNWAKFSATAGLGVINKGHLKEGRTLLGPYLPQGAQVASPYSEGGALYALGIIHANHGEEITKYLQDALRNANNNETVQHGACLGLGLSAMATGNDEIYEELKGILYNDGAVSGEAAGLAMGLVMLGTASDKALSEMIAYAHETQHEKIIRGLAIGIALVMYGREEGAETLVHQLLMDKDAILRYGAMYTIALAYCGTGNNNAVRRLLHVAVSDVSDDVRRAAVTALGFVLSRQPERCPKMVALLAESYNPHVRYGAALALGISCAATASKEALDLLEPLASDPIDFVRQGALIALAMVLIQTSKAQEPRVETARKLFEEKIADKHEDVMCKFGAIIASGIIDAGGRNATIALHSRAGHKNMSAMVGLAVFTQFWYWFPLAHFVSLAFVPTAIVGLNKDLKLVKFTFKSNTRPSLFAYPPEVKPPAVVAPQKVSTAVLSFSRGRGAATPAPAPAAAKPAAKPAAADKGKGPEAMDATPTTEKKEEEKKEEPEATNEVKDNFSRVTTVQAKYLSFDVDDRYTPVKTSDVYGFVLLRDRQPGQPEEFVTLGTDVQEGPEPEPPAPFFYNE